MNEPISLATIRAVLDDFERDTQVVAFEKGTLLALVAAVEAAHRLSVCNINAPAPELSALRAALSRFEADQ